MKEEEEAETTCWMTHETEAEVKWTTCQHLAGAGATASSSHPSANNYVQTKVLTLLNKAINRVTDS